MAFSQNVDVDVALEDRLDQSDILALRDSSTVVDLSAEHVQHFIRDIIVSLDELLELSSGHDQVFVGEGVWDVPADRTELSSILDNSMEEAESEEKLLVDFWLGALFELLRSHCFIRLQNV